MNAIEHGANRFDEPSVIVGVDGSRTALIAVRWAAAEARLCSLPLWILHAAPYAAGHAGPTVRRAKDILARAYTVARRAEPGLSVATGSTERPPVESLLDAAEGARLLVVGMDGGERLQELLIGSVALDVCGRASCPVTVVRGHHAKAGERPVLVGVVTPAVDGAALAVAFADARRHAGPLVVLHAWHGADLLHGYRAGHDEAARIAARDRPADQLAPWVARYPDVPVELEIVHGQPAPALLSAAVRARMVVVGTRGRNAPARALFGSTSRQVLRRCSVPVTVVRPDVVLPEDGPGATEEQEPVAQAVNSVNLDARDRSQLW
jgi:nucleotide-binding universal stress UspA family protein